MLVWRLYAMTFDFSLLDGEALLEATYETLYMTIIALIGTFIFGLALGLFLYLTDKDGLWENKFFNFITATFVNVFRAIPFIILIIFLILFWWIYVGII